MKLQIPYGKISGDKVGKILHHFVVDVEASKTAELLHFHFSKSVNGGIIAVMTSLRKSSNSSSIAIVSSGERTRSRKFC